MPTVEKVVVVVVRVLALIAVGAGLMGFLTFGFAMSAMTSVAPSSTAPPGMSWVVWLMPALYVLAGLALYALSRPIARLVTRDLVASGDVGP